MPNIERHTPFAVEFKNHMGHLNDALADLVEDVELQNGAGYVSRIEGVGWESADVDEIAEGQTVPTRRSLELFIQYESVTMRKGDKNAIKLQNFLDECEEGKVEVIDEAQTDAVTDTTEDLKTSDVALTEVLPGVLTPTEETVDTMETMFDLTDKDVKKRFAGRVTELRLLKKMSWGTVKSHVNYNIATFISQMKTKGSGRLVLEVVRTFATWLGVKPEALLTAEDFDVEDIPSRLLAEETEANAEETEANAEETEANAEETEANAEEAEAEKPKKTKTKKTKKPKKIKVQKSEVKLVDSNKTEASESGVSETGPSKDVIGFVSGVDEEAEGVDFKALLATHQASGDLSSDVAKAIIESLLLDKNVDLPSLLMLQEATMVQVEVDNLLRLRQIPNWESLKSLTMNDVVRALSGE